MRYSQTTTLVGNKTSLHEHFLNSQLIRINEHFMFCTQPLRAQRLILSICATVIHIFCCFCFYTLAHICVYVFALRLNCGPCGLLQHRETTAQRHGRCFSAESSTERRPHNLYLHAHLSLSQQTDSSNLHCVSSLFILLIALLLLLLFVFQLHCLRFFIAVAYLTITLTIVMTFVK